MRMTDAPQARAGAGTPKSFRVRRSCGYAAGGGYTGLLRHGDFAADNEGYGK